MKAFSKKTAFPSECLGMLERQAHEWKPIRFLIPRRLGGRVSASCGFTGVAQLPTLPLAQPKPSEGWFGENVGLQAWLGSRLATCDTAGSAACAIKTRPQL